MRQTKWLGVLTLAVSLLMVGCKDTSSPKGIVDVAAKALRESKFDDFVSTLHGRAKLEYGTEQGMVDLKKHLYLFTDLRTDDRFVTYLGQEKYKDGFWKGYVKNDFYRVEIQGKRRGHHEAALTNDVACTYHYYFEPTDQDPLPPRVIWQIHCLITDIRL